MSDGTLYTGRNGTGARVVGSEDPACPAQLIQRRIETIRVVTEKTRT